MATQSDPDKCRYGVVDEQNTVADDDELENFATRTDEAFELHSAGQICLTVGVHDLVQVVGGIRSQIRPLGKE
jgi:hypothetical protein